MPVSASRPETGVCETHDLSERVPCPIDPSHTVRASKLSVHLHVCASKQHEQPWLVKNANVPSPAPSQVEQPSAESLDKPPTASLLTALESACAALNVGEIPMEVIVPEELVEYVETAPLSRHNKECVKHRLQYASIIGHLLRLMAWHAGAAPTDDTWTTFFELGAGSGFLSVCLRQVVRSERATFVLVDRSAPPHRRADRKLRKEALGSLPTNFIRVRCDLADFRPDGLVGHIEQPPCARARAVTAKHLCGSATDLALRCFCAAAADQPVSLAIALCCYHKCTWYRTHASHTRVHAPSLAYIPRTHSHAGTHALTQAVHILTNSRVRAHCALNHTMLAQAHGADGAHAVRRRNSRPDHSAMPATARARCNSWDAGLSGALRNASHALQVGCRPLLHAYLRTLVSMQGHDRVARAT
jgi:hypothetical protein